VLDCRGSWKWLHSRGRCIRDAWNAPVRLFLAAHDISARKEAEAARSSLEKRMQEVRRMEALVTLAGGIAHDFNNLLGAILGFGGMASELAGEGSPVGRHIDRVLQAGRRASSLVERILQFSGSGTTGTSPVNMQWLVEEVVLIHSPSLPEGVSVETRLRAPQAAVAGDATGLYQLVSNLYTNAVEAVGTAGQVRVVLGTVQVAASKVLLHGQLEIGDYVRLDVEDSGPGMEPEMIGRMFEPFFTTKSSGEGAGLGLSVVHGIVVGLAGAIDVRSEPGAGTRVSIWLPSVLPDDPPSSESRAGTHGHGEVVLVIDDEQLLVELAVERLTDLGYATLAYTSSQEALRAFLAAPADIAVVLTDEKMPDLSGSQLVAAIRARGHAVPVILMTGHVTAALEERMHAVGVCALLPKPVSREAMAAALQRCLRSDLPP
jgi:signal transduction histidine kinase/ActR/RegA family two-component response regulator